MPNVYLAPLSRSQRKQLVAARLAAGLTQAELAGKAGTSRVQLAYCESGKRPPSEDLLRRWCKSLGLRCEVKTTVEIARKE